MKKLMLSIAAMGAVVCAAAQSNPIEMYPNEKGDIIVNQCFDADGNLRATMKYTIADSNLNEADSSLEIVFVLTDANNEVVDYGTIFADYAGGDLSLRMSNRPETTNVERYLSMNTKMMNDFLDYPDPFISDPLLNPGPFQFEAADYTIKVGERNRDFVNVKVSNRDYVGNEKVETPAGEFDASKITFALEVYNNDTKHTDKYQGTEWYTVGTGIVRTEIADQNGNLLDYSEVTELSRIM